MSRIQLNLENNRENGNLQELSSGADGEDYSGPPLPVNHGGQDNSEREPMPPLPATPGVETLPPPRQLRSRLKKV